MSYFRKGGVYILNCFLYLWVVKGLYHPASTSAGEISEDYGSIWGNAWDRDTSGLRTRELTCADEILQRVCQERCGKTYSCIQDKCFCPIKPTTPGVDANKNIDKSLDEIEQLLSWYEKNTNIDVYSNEETPEFFLKDVLHAKLKDVTPDRAVIELTSEKKTTEHPTLRHHIAHFCPNLEDARQCIRMCMKKGKPAFCGKDHVCYCGHTYTSNDQEHPLNLDDMYAEFRDLYEKYFGPQGNPRGLKEKHTRTN